MTTSHPPRLALALLRRSLPDNEPLIGDLLEAFAARRSRLWFWRQTLLAILLTTVRGAREVRPLRLIDPDFPAEPRQPADAPLPGSINLTASPVAGVGGLGMLALAVLVVVVYPQAWWVAAAGVLAGVVFAAGLILIRRRQIRSSPPGAPRLFTPPTPGGR